MVRPYYKAVEDFLRRCESMKVQSMALVALVDEKDAYDIVSTYKTGPHELASCAGILQLEAGYLYNEINRGYDEEEEENDEE